MAKSAELKTRITERIKNEWDNPDAGADWKEFFEEGSGLTDELFKQITSVKNWKRIFKGREGDLILREFDFDMGEDSDFALVATVTCDEDDNFLDIEFQVY